MPAQYTRTISFGSHPEIGGKREKLYNEAAKRLTDGNLSKMICMIVDEKLGINLPLPGMGRPAKPSKASTRISTKGSKTPRQQ
jgi:hypothetical protein